MVFLKSMGELRQETGEEKLSRAIAWHMKHGLHKKDVSYFKIAK